MSTQSARPILFTHSTPQHAFRLLELTPELVELLSKEEGTTYGYFYYPFAILPISFLEIERVFYIHTYIHTYMKKYTNQKANEFPDYN